MEHVWRGNVYIEVPSMFRSGGSGISATCLELIKTLPRGEIARLTDFVKAVATEHHRSPKAISVYVRQILTNMNEAALATYHLEGEGRRTFVARA